MFDRLPQELLNFIISEISTKDAKNLSQTSKHFHSATLQSFWESVVIPAWSENDTYGIKIDDFPVDRLAFTKSIDLRFITENDRRACPHNRRLQTCREADDENIVAKLASFENFKEKVLPLLEKCDKEQLESFSWDLGTCIPAPILGSNGIVARQQSTISSLKLTTHPFCTRYNSRERKIDLSAFHHLLNLSWRGPTSDNLKVFAFALRNNKSHLQALELDLTDWPYMRKALGYRNDEERVYRLRARDYVAKMVLGLDKRSPRITFPNLHTLVLSHVPLTDTLVQAIDFEVLRSLTIRACPQWYDFVLAMAQHRIPVKLKKLEFQESWPKNDAATDDLEDGDPTEILLDSFQGLEEFYLDQTGMMLSKYTWDNVCHHSSTLKRFVNHSRFYDDELEDWTDLPDMMINERDKKMFWDDPTSSPLYHLDLDFIGLSCEPINLLDVFNPFSRKDCLKVVHVRQSRKNMQFTSRSWGIKVIIDDVPVDDTPAVDEGENPSNEYLEPMFWAFVEWAFSYKGIKSLEYIVFGDYGRPERTSGGNLLICREGYGSEDFHIIRESCSAPEWDYVKKEYGDAMRCCPSDPLFEVPKDHAH